MEVFWDKSVITFTFGSGASVVLAIVVVVVVVVVVVSWPKQRWTVATTTKRLVLADESIAAEVLFVISNYVNPLSRLMPLQKDWVTPTDMCCLILEQNYGTSPLLIHDYMSRWDASHLVWRSQAYMLKRPLIEYCRFFGFCSNRILSYFPMSVS